jgi:hypothetical protein
MSHNKRRHGTNHKSHHNPKVSRSTDDDFTGNEVHTSMVGKKTLKNRPKPKQSKETKARKRQEKQLKKHPPSLFEQAKDHPLPHEEE